MASPRVLEDSVHPRLQSGASGRPLKFTVRCMRLSTARAFFGLALSLLVGFFVLSGYYTHVSPSHPNSATGQTYEIGTRSLRVYVRQREFWTLFGLVGGVALSAACGTFFRERGVSDYDRARATYSHPPGPDDRT